jgi:hypothetical protein
MTNLLPIKELAVKEKLVDDSNSHQAKLDIVISLSDINQRTIKTYNQDFAARKDNQPSQQFYISPARDLKCQTVLVWSNGKNVCSIVSSVKEFGSSTYDL